MLDFDLFTRVVDEAGAVARSASTSSTTARRSSTSARVEMCEYIKSRYPHVYLYTSTNGLAFTEEQARRLARSGHRRGHLLDRRRDAGELRRSTGSAATSTRRSATCARSSTRSATHGRDVPFVNWRYILFTHNDSDEEMDAGAADGRRHRRRSPVLGDHRSSREHVLAPLRAGHAPTTTRIRHEIWDDNNLGNAIPGATPRAQIDMRDVRGSTRDRQRPLKAAPGSRSRCSTRVTNLSTRPFPAQASYGRRLVRLGAQLCAADGALINRDYERAWLPAHLQPGATVDVPITVTAPGDAGPLPAEVRSGQRRDRLVRGVRIADDDERRW